DGVGERAHVLADGWDGLAHVQLACTWNAEPSKRREVTPSQGRWASAVGAWRSHCARGATVASRAFVGLGEHACEVGRAPGRGARDRADSAADGSAGTSGAKTTPDACTSSPRH